MKKNYLFLLLFIIGSSVSSYAQQKKVEDEYAAYFTLPREALYVHLNKTTYLQGEEIWLKGYAYDQKNQLTSKATTNIHVGVYNANGKQVQKALFRAENGVAKGNILIDSTFTSGTYYVKAETNWMKNFKESNAFIQKIEVLSEKITEKNALETAENYDFQFLPEGGNLVANSRNTVGFKVINTEGNGVLATGVIYDANQNKIITFETNGIGLGKFLFNPKANEEYTAKIRFETGKEITKVLPKANEKGIALTLNDPFQDKIMLNFHTNEATLAKFPNNKYKVLIHQNGKQKTIEFSFDNASQKVLTILKKDLYKGVNTITVFTEDNTPILERLFFNDYFLKTTALNVAKVSTVNDSIVFSINESQLQDNINLSISVLPELTKSYKPTHNIVSYFYLKPHVKGTVENPQYYFRNINRKKKYELDILLLTQGWSRYDWKNIFEEKPNGNNRFENGITIIGKVNRPKQGIDRLFLYATKNHAARFIDIDKDQSFTLTNLFLEKGEEIRFSYMNKKGIFKKPSVYLRFKVSDGNDEIPLKVLQEKTSVLTNASSFQVPKNFFYKEAEQLDRVVIKAKKKKEERDPILMNAKITKVTKEIYERYFNVTDFIVDNGYDVYENMGQISIFTRRRPRATPLVFYDGAQLTNLSILYGLSTANVEKIVIDKTGQGQGMNAGFGGVIRIFSRQTPLFEKGPGEKVYTSAKAPQAFSPTKEYYAPRYASYLSNTFEKYGTISWIPEIKLSKSEVSNFKIYDTRTKNVTLFIEGISESGELISERKTIQVR
ncbi:hypothetical protein KORDIASMS9_00453 [Kordia sp. SMS9]|uniref:hypothetical protein n=1 Tax=Kordia sp. SMS9 TaxID=2282170 RepID=UPI000E0D0C5B|nr:hypothetical protein [Kordia sp. SMS9]AXG68260.1 hypothetical protein KORDIASMS9_00453 [Kordia sp. SMS9]